MHLKSVSAIFAAILSISVELPAQSRDHKLMNSYYAQWTVYNGYTIKTVDTSGTARHLDILTYAFVNIGTNAKGQYECTSYDSWADNGTPAGSHS